MIDKKLYVALSACIITLLTVGSGAIAAENNTSKIEKFILDKINSQLDIKVESTARSADSKVFSCNFYKVKPWLKNEDGSKETWGKGYQVVETQGELTVINSPESDANNSQLISCIKDGFVVNSEDQAKVLLGALLGPEGERFSAKTQVLKSAEGWHLIVGTFFDSFKGYQVKTDHAGKVLEISYSMELPAI